MVEGDEAVEGDVAEPMAPLCVLLWCDRRIPDGVVGAPAPWPDAVAPLGDIDPVIAPCDGSVGDIEPDGDTCDGALGDIEPVVSPGEAMAPPEAPPDGAF